jgi:hypothetical protein
VQIAVDPDHAITCIPVLPAAGTWRYCADIIPFIWTCRHKVVRFQVFLVIFFPHVFSIPRT